MSDPLSRTFAALADPTRRAILARLATGECTVGELAKPFAMSGPAVSKHLKVLERAGLITRGREAQRRARSCWRSGAIPSTWPIGGDRKCFATTTSSFDRRGGGVWRFAMHGPDGRDYQNRITFHEIMKPERIGYHHDGEDDVEDVQFRTTVSFEELGRNRTRLTLHARFASAA